MKPLLRLMLVFAFALPSFAVTPSGETGKIEAEIRRLEGVRIDALLKGDLKALEQLFADELVYIHSAGKIDTKPGYLTMLAAGNLNYVTLRYDPAPRIVVHGGDTAVVTGRATIETKNKAGQVTKRVLTTTTVYVRSATTWRVVSYQGTPVSP